MNGRMQQRHTIFLKTRKMTSLYVLIIFIALSTGCSLHRLQKVDLSVVPPASYVEAGEQFTSEKPIEEWWKTFNDPKLNELMNEAFSDNLDIEEAIARLYQLEATYRKTASSQQPFLNGEGEVSRERSPTFLGDNTGNSYRFSLAAGYEIDLWQKIRSRTNAAELDFEASREDVKTLYLSLSARLADVYYLAAEQRSQLELTDKTIETFEDTVIMVERRYREGLVSALDVYQARQNLAAARSRRPVFETNLAVAEHAIAVLLGKYPGRDTTGMVTELPALTSTFPVGIPSAVLARRPDVHASFLRLRASDERIGEAVADRFPSFNLLGSYGSSSTSFSTGDVSGVFWNILISAVQPLLDGGRRRAEVDRTKALYRENLAAYHKTVLKAFQEVEDALARYRSTEHRIEMLEESVAVSSGSLRLSLMRYMFGLSDYLPVLAAQPLLFDSRSQLLDSRRQLISDRISLARALGGEWMEQELEERLIAENREEEDRE